jgi:hypothetical protein
MEGVASVEDVGEIANGPADVAPAATALCGIKVVGALTAATPLEKSTTNSGGRGLMRQPCVTNAEEEAM